MVELPGRRIAAANDGFSPPQEDEREEEVVVASQPEPAPEPQSRLAGFAQEAAPLAPPAEPQAVPVPQSTEIPPLPGKDYSSILKQLDPEADRWLEQDREAEKDPVKSTFIKDAPPALKQVFAEERKKRTQDLLQATGPELATKAAKNENSIAGYIENKANEAKAKEDVKSFYDYVSGFADRFNPFSSEKLATIQLMVPYVARQLGLEPPEEGSSEYMKGARSGAASTTAMTYSGLAQYAASMGDEKAKQLFDMMAAQSSKEMRDSEFMSPRVRSYADITKEDFAQDLIDYISFSAGQAIGNMAPTIAAMTAAGPVGGAGFLYTMSLGEVRDELMQAGIKDETKIAQYSYALGAGIAALDSITSLGVVKSLTGEARKKVVKGITKAFIRGAARGGLTEGVTEMTQELMLIGGVSHAKDAKAIFDAAPVLDAYSQSGNWERVINAGIAGALGGMQVGGPSRVVENTRRQQQLAAKGRGMGMGQQEAAPIEPAAPVTPAEPAEPTGPELGIEPEPQVTRPRPPEEDEERGDTVPELITDDPAVLEAQRELANLKLELEAEDAAGTPPIPPVMPSIEEPNPVPPPLLETEVPAPTTPQSEANAWQAVTALDTTPDGQPVTPETFETTDDATIEASAAPIRDALRQAYGDTITVYAVPDDTAGRFARYTTDPNVAAGEVGTRPSALVIDDATIALAERALRDAGRARVGARVFEQDGDGPVSIFDQDGNFLTEAPSLRDAIAADNEVARALNDERNFALDRVERLEIPVSSIVWATDRFGQKEIIARGEGPLLADEVAAPDVGVDTAEGVTNDVRERFDDVLRGKARRDQWADEVGVDEDTLDSLIEEALADGRLTMVNGIPRRARQDATAARMTGPTRDLAADPTQPEPTELIPDTAAGERIARLNTSIQRNYVRALYEAALDRAQFEATASYLLNDENLTTSEVLDIVEAYTGTRPSALIKRRSTAIRKLRDAFEERVRDVEIAQMRGSDVELAPSNLVVRPDIQPQIERLVRDIEQARGMAPFAVELHNFLVEPKSGLAMAGKYQNSVLALSLDRPIDELMRVMRHEMIHALRGVGVITEAHMKALVSVGKRKPSRKEALRIIDRMANDGAYAAIDENGRADFSEGPVAAIVAQLQAQAGKLTYRQIYRIDEQYTAYVKAQAPNIAAQDLQDILDEELVAHVAEDWVDGRNFGTRVERAMNAIRDFLQSLRDRFIFSGYTSANQIFDSVFSGQLSRQAERSRARAATGRWASQSMMAARGASTGIANLDAAARMMERRLKAGNSERVSNNVIQAVSDAILPDIDILPEGYEAGIITSIQPDGFERTARGEDGNLLITFTNPVDDSTFTLKIAASQALRLRAVRLPAGYTSTGRPAVLFFHRSTRNVSRESLRGELWHEAAHAVWDDNRSVEFGRLLGHANSLGVLDIRTDDYYEMIGVQSAGGNRGTLRQRYNFLYSEAGLDADAREAAIDREAVAHMVELYSHGHYSTERMAPVQDILDTLVVQAQPGIAMAAARGERRTLSIPGLKSVVEKRIAEQEAATPRRDPSLSGIFRPEVPLDWAGLEDAEFYADVVHIADKRRMKDADLPQPETPEAVVEHINEVLAGGGFAYIYQPERGPESLNLIKPGPRYDMIVAMDLDQRQGRYYIRTAFNQRKERTSRGLIKAVDAGGVADVWWKTDQDSRSEILKRIVQAPNDSRGPSRNVLRTAVLQSQEQPAMAAMRGARRAATPISGDPGLLPNGDHVDRISTRWPALVSSTEDPIAERLVIDQDAMRATPDAYRFNAGIVRGYVNWPKANRDRNPDKVFEAFKEQIKDNLRFLYDQVPPEIRDQSKRWYDGARIITDQWSEDFNQPPRAIAGVLAALSPGKDWYANVSMGERMLDIWTERQDHKWDGRMTKTANRVVDPKTGKQFLDRETLKAAKGKTLAQLIDEGDLRTAGAFIRVYDETYHDPLLRVVSATGEFIGDPQQKVNWQSYSLIGKAVSVLVDPSYENISAAMGEAHKIRNFYNNILAPNARFGDVTIDTHAIAAALLRPLAQKSTEVAHGLGTSPAPGVQNVKAAGVSGSKGLYGIYADAYREAAQDLQVLPRELQSITWEAVRGLYPRAWKRDANVAMIDGIWRDYKDGRVSLAEARARILDAAGGIESPSWFRPDGEVALGQFDTSYESELSRGRVSGRAEGRVQQAARAGTRGDATRRPANLAKYAARARPGPATPHGQYQLPFDQTPEDRAAWAESQGFDTSRVLYFMPAPTPQEQDQLGGAQGRGKIHLFGSFEQLAKGAVGDPVKAVAVWVRGKLLPASTYRDEFRRMAGIDLAETTDPATVQEYSRRLNDRYMTQYTGIEEAWRDGRTGRYLATQSVAMFDTSDILPVSENRSVDYVGPMAAIRGYHGSGARFTHFDFSYMGTGEGAQARGWGVYIADAKGTAKTYMPRQFDVESFALSRYNRAVAVDDYASAEAWERAMMHETPDEIRAYAAEYADDPDYIDAFDSVADALERKIEASETIASLYEVDFNVEQEDLLDLDLPIAQQPAEVLKRLEPLISMPRERRDELVDMITDDFESNGPLGYSADRFERVVDEAIKSGGYGSEFGYGVWDEIREAAPNKANEFIRAVAEAGVGLDWESDTGASAYEIVASGKVGQEIADAFKAAGIPGMRFLDQMSRDGEGDTYNYVVFDLDKLEIKKRNGQPISKGERGFAMAALRGGEPATAEAEIDDLRFYSGLQVAALGLKQLKGTPEQMLAQLKKAGGVREAEIAAVGLDKMLEGRNSVTKEEILEIVELGRVRLLESIYEHAGKRWSNIIIDDEEMTAEQAIEQLQDPAPYRDLYARMKSQNEMSPNRPDRFQEKVLEGVVEQLRLEKTSGMAEWYRIVRASDRIRRPKWSGYSIDPRNETYHETTLVVPPPRLTAEVGEFRPMNEGTEEEGMARWPSGNVDVSGVTAAEVDIGQDVADITHYPQAPGWPGGVYSVWSNQIQNAHFGTLEEAVAEIEKRHNESANFRDRDDVFTQMHFPEDANVAVHTRASIQPDEKGDLNYTINELQSDWGQAYTKWERTRPQQAASSSVLRRLGAIKAQLDIYDNATRVWYSLQKPSADPYDQVPMGFVAPLRDDAQTIARKEVAEIHHTTVDEIDDVTGYEEADDYVHYWTRERERTYAEMDNALRTQPFHQEILDELEKREAAAEAAVKAEAAKYAEANNVELPDAVLDSHSWFEFESDLERRESMTHPMAQAWNNWIVTQQLTDIYRDRAGLADPASFGPFHPLIETTDNWVNLGLRRALIRAVEAGADYIAIASGETVDSLNMGTPITGALYAYNQMYPKKMRDILKRIDKEAAEPEKVRDLVSSVVDIAKEKAAAEQLSRAEGADDAESILRVLTINNRVGSSKKYRVFKSQAAKDDDGNWLYDVFIEGKMITDNPVSAEAADKLVDQWKANLSGGYGFVRFKITPKVRDTVLKNGLPMMAARAREPRGPNFLDRIRNRQASPQKPRQLNRIIADLKKTLGIETTQRLFQLDIKVGESTLRLRPPKGKGYQYVRESGSAGVRQTRNIRAIARAGGFALERIVGQPLDDIKTQFADELVPDGMVTPPGGQELSEAFTRWFERYVTDRDGARLQAPNFFAVFEDVLDAEAPAVLQDLAAVSGAYTQYIQQATPDQVAADLVSVYSKNDWKTIVDEGRNMAETTNGKMATAWTSLVDDMHPVKMLVRRLLAVADQNGIKDEQGRPISLKVAENAYKLARMFRGAHATGYTYITKGIPYYRGNGVMFPGLQKALDTLFQGGRYSEQEYKTFGNYLVHRRAVKEYELLEQKEQRLAGLDQQISQSSEMLRLLRQRSRQDTERLQSRRQQLAQLTGALRTRELDLRRAVNADQTMQQRLGDIGQDIADTLQQIEGFEEQKFELNRRLEAIEGEIPQELMEGIRQMAEGPGGLRQNRSQLQRRQQLMNRDAQRARVLRERLEQDVDVMSTDIAMLQAEVTQLQERTQAQMARIDGGREALELLRAERERVRKIGASRPPTLEPKSFHLDQIAKIEADPRYANIKEAAKIAYDYNFGLLTLKYQAGLVPQDQYEYLARRRDWYVPFIRDMSDTPGGSIFQASGSSRTFSPFKKFDGSDRAIINPLEQMSAEAYRTAQHIAMNDMINALAGLAERAGEGAGAIAQVLDRRSAEPEAFDAVVDYAIQFGIDPMDATLMAQSLETDWTNDAMETIWSPSSKGPSVPPTLPLWRDGKRTFVAVLDPEFGQDAVNAMKGMGQEQINMVLDTAFGTPARILQIGVTTSPTFMPRNLIRDIFDAWIKVGALPIITQVRGAREMWNDSDFYRAYMEAGGIVGGRNVAALTQREQQLKLLDLDPKAARPSSIAMGAVAGGILGTIVAGPIGGLIGAAAVGYGTRTGQVLKTVESVETMTRIGVAAHAYREAKKNAPDLSEQEAILEAAYVARDVFDWNRRGSRTLAILRTVTFLNAQVQGMARAAEGLAGESDRGSAVARNSVRRHLSIVFKRENGLDLSADEVRELRNAYKTWGRMMLYTVGLLGLYALFADDDDYDDALDKSKATHSWLPNVLGVDIRIPKAFEWAVPANVAEIMWEAYTGRDPRWGERMAKSVHEVLTPPALPQAFTLAAGYLTNRNVSAVLDEPRSIIPEWERGLAPEDQFNHYTSRLARDVVSAMNSAGVPRSLQPSPYMIDFTLRTGGYWGNDIRRSYDFARQAVTGEVGMEMRVPEWPVLGGFTGNLARQSSSVDQFYRMMSLSGGTFYEVSKSYKDRLDNQGRPDLAQQLLLEVSPDERAFALVQYHGTADQKKLHPLRRFESLNRVLRKLSTDVVTNQLTPGRRRARKLSDMQQDIIGLDAKTKTAIVDVTEKIRRAEAWNTMVFMGRPGWEGKQERDVDAILEVFRATSPEAYAAFETRMREAKVQRWDRVKSRWPRLRDRLLSRYGPVEDE